MVKIKIFDEAGHLLMTDHVRNENGFSKPYNFADAGLGKYTFEITDHKGKVYKEFNYTVRNIDKGHVALLPISGSQKYKLVVSQTNGATILVNVYDQKSNLIFKERIRRPEGFSKTYDLSNLKVGSIEVVGGDQILARFEI